MIKVKITSKKRNDFAGADGMVAFFWYKAIWAEDQVEREFGSADGGHAEGETLELDLFRKEDAKGKIVWRERVSKA